MRTKEDITRLIDNKLIDEFWKISDGIITSESIYFIGKSFADKNIPTYKEDGLEILFHLDEYEHDFFVDIEVIDYIEKKTYSGGYAYIDKYNYEPPLTLNETPSIL